ncbi:MAG: hypothetical protein U9Q81_07295 [Pseudomonadota bacterium]|nr:hypothetical protein [Pseudomonadota bacterium]
MAMVETAHERAAQGAQASTKDRLIAWLKEHATQVNWFLSLVGAGLMLWAAVQWGERASDLTRPCVAAELPPVLCGEVPEYLQRFQLVVAVLGIATAVTSAVLSVVQAILGRTLHIMRYAVGFVLATAVLWVAAYWFGRIVYL